MINLINHHYNYAKAENNYARLEYLTIQIKWNI